MDARALDDRPRRRVDAQGGSGLGQPQGARRSARHRRPGAQDAAGARRQLAGGPADAEVGGRREPDPSSDRERLHRSEAGQGRDGGSRPPDQRAAGVTPYLFLAPGLLLFAAFRLYPLLEGLRLSLTNARLGRASYQYVGLANYARLADDTRFHVSLGNTAFYTVASTLPVLAVPLLLALALNRGRLRNVLRSLFFFPFTLSVVTVGLAWLWLLDPVVGPFNYYLRTLGVPARSWLADPQTAMWAIIATTVWWVTGYYLVVYLAGLQDIPRDLYEAAALDGAGGWRSFWTITVPLLRPVLLFVVVTHVIGSFQLFGQVFVLTGGGPGDATRTVVQHLYETAFQNFFQFGAASAMAWVLFAIVLVFSVLQFRLLRGHTEF
ncbi:MAG: ABC transporter permease subunit [Candidatus Rokuibacteriota bacterium]|nr:MAG: ABC transporter permease subunit [Candidatus Rokubacteria bacterium]